jgi:hypothetical protein
MAVTEKVSITLGRAELRGAKRLASRLGLSLSTFVNDAVKRRLEAQERKQAGLEVLATFDSADRATPKEMDALLSSWSESGGPRGRTQRAKGSPRHSRKRAR